MHHAMRAVALAKREFEMICERALSRYTQGGLLAEKQMVQEMVADAWLELTQFRLLILQAAWVIEKEGYGKARRYVASHRALDEIESSALLAGILASCALLALLGVTTRLEVALALLVGWGLIFAATMPIRQAYLNGLIPSEQRATVLSFDNLLGSSGGVVIQPALGKVADVWSYSVSYLVAAGIQVLAVPFVVLARRERVSSDPVEVEPAQQGG